MVRRARISASSGRAIRAHTILFQRGAHGRTQDIVSQRLDHIPRIKSVIGEKLQHADQANTHGALSPKRSAPTPIIMPPQVDVSAYGR